MQKTAAYYVGVWNFFFSDSKITFFGPRGVFFPPFSSFQDLLSLFKIYWVRPDQLEPYHSNQWLDQSENLIKLLSNSVNFEGPLPEPACSCQIKYTIVKAFRIYWVTRVNFPGCFRGVKCLQTTPKKFCGLVTYTKDTFCKKFGHNRPIVSTAGSETIYRRL